MGQFLNENFMLYNETGRRLFHTYAEQLPIIDYHCHISPQRFMRIAASTIYPRSGWEGAIPTGPISGITISGESCGQTGHRRIW